MSLQQWHDNGWLREHHTDLQELSNLLAIADRDIADAATAELSNDWKFDALHDLGYHVCHQVEVWYNMRMKGNAE